MCVCVCVCVCYAYRSIERAAQHEAMRTEQKAKGELERQKLQNEKVQMYNKRRDPLNYNCSTEPPTVTIHGPRGDTI